MFKWLISHKFFSLFIFFGVLSGFFLKMNHPGHPHRFTEKPFHVVKGWWPGWEAFQLGVLENEESLGIHSTKFIQAKDYQQAVEFFVRDDADAATLTIFEAMILASRGIKFKIILMIDYTTGSDGLIAHQQISHIRNLLGKRIGVIKGTVGHFTVLKALEKAGLSVNDVKLTGYSHADLVKAFLDKKIDAMGTYEPVMSGLVKASGANIIFSSSEIPRSICDVLLVKDSLIEKDSAMIEHWIHSWSFALRKYYLNPDHFFVEIGLLGNMDKNRVRDAFGGIFLTDFRENIIAFGDRDHPGYLYESLSEMNQFMVSQNVISEPVNVSELIYFDAARMMPTFGDRDKN